MPVPSLGIRLLAASVVFAAGVAFSPAATAQMGPAGQVVQEPNGFWVPEPANPLEVACCVTGRGYPANAADLSGLFAFRGEAIDWRRDARKSPGVFSPLCGFSGTLVLRGGDCKLDFGWYNVNASGQAPTNAEIFTIIPNNDPAVYGAMGMNVDFCPLAGVSTNVGENGKCQLKEFNAADIRNDPNYKGGLVGFALRGNPMSKCTETHYSQNELHTRCTNCSSMTPWIMTLIYQSSKNPNAYYLAFEDQPAGDFGGGKPNDGDFNDFVFYISGVTCEGGGQPCDVSATNPAVKGVCAAGTTNCTSDGTAPVCTQTIQPVAEKCDNLDNNCNGLIDDGDGLCAANQVCDRGTCVNSCAGGEFPCPAGLACNPQGFCVDPLCKDKVCAEGQVCRAGVCAGGCEGAKCPTGQVCALGRCVDLCKGLTCADNEVCEKGVCITNCECRPCAEGQTCVKSGADEGRCVDTGCEGKTCAAGQLCVQGTCQDTCTGAVCPGGASCMTGECGEPMTSGPVTGGSTGLAGGFQIPVPGASGSTGPGTGSGGQSSSTGGRGSGAGPERGAPDSGCGCRVVGSTPSGSAAGLGAVGLGLVLSALRRRRSRRA